MQSSGRMRGLLLLMLVIAGLAVALNSYVDREASQIVDAAPSAQAVDAEDEPQVVEEPVVSEVDQRECAAAQAEYDEAWDRSVEDPQDEEAEGKLEEELTKLLNACGE